MGEVHRLPARQVLFGLQTAGRLMTRFRNGCKIWRFLLKAPKLYGRRARCPTGNRAQPSGYLTPERCAATAPRSARKRSWS